MIYRYYLSFILLDNNKKNQNIMLLVLYRVSISLQYVIVSLTKRYLNSGTICKDIPLTLMPKSDPSSKPSSGLIL